MGEVTTSVVITTFNRAKLLERAVRSVLAQTRQDFEIIIVEDCGSDNSQEVIERLGDKRITYIRLPTNRGSSIAKMAGIRRAVGKYIVTLDDSKEFLPTFLEESIRALEYFNPSASAVKVGRVIKQADYTDYAPPITHTGFDTIDWGVLMKREVFDVIGYDPNIYGDEDADFGIQFAKHFQWTYVDRPLQVAYPGEIEQTSNSRPSPRRLKGLEYFLKKNWNEYQKDKNELSYILRLAGRNFYKAGYKLKGIKYFWLSFMARKNIRTFLHFFFILFGWRVYDWYMNWQERRSARVRLEDNAARF